VLQAGIQKCHPYLQMLCQSVVNSSLACAKDKLEICVHVVHMNAFEDNYKTPKAP
jgi:hypothetical protein